MSGERLSDASGARAGCAVAQPSWSKQRRAICPQHHCFALSRAEERVGACFERNGFNRSAFESSLSPSGPLPWRELPLEDAAVVLLFGWLPDETETTPG